VKIVIEFIAAGCKLIVYMDETIAKILAIHSVIAIPIHKPAHDYYKIANGLKSNEMTCMIPITDQVTKA